MFIVTSPWLFQSKYISIHIYGVSITLGLCMAVWNILKDPVLKRYNLVEQATKIITYSLIFGLCGGRLLWAVEYWNEIDWIDFITITTPGYSLLGAVAAVIGVVIWNMKDVASDYHFILADRLALFAPLVIACGRIGCFFTGCCYGIETDVLWKICYAHPDVEAPLDVFIHPVQLYSALWLLIFFGILYRIQHRNSHGILLIVSLQGIFLERMVNDFFRDERNIYICQLSLHQIGALGAIITTLCFFIYTYKSKKENMR